MSPLADLLRRMGLSRDRRLATTGPNPRAAPPVYAGVTVVGRPEVRPFTAQIGDLSEGGFSLVAAEGAALAVKEGIVLDVVIALPAKTVRAYALSAHGGTAADDAAGAGELIGARITQMSAEDREALSTYLHGHGG